MVRRLNIQQNCDINYTSAFTSPSHKYAVTTILTALFATTLAQVIIEWQYIYVCFLREMGSRLDTFFLSVEGTPIVITLGVLMQGLGQILADALLVCKKLLLLAENK